MANVCPSCGKENRDQARFCRGCARPLDRPGGDTASDELARERANRALRRARRRKRSGERSERPAWLRWAGALTAGAVVLAYVEFGALGGSMVFGGIAVVTMGGFIAWMFAFPHTAIGRRIMLRRNLDVGQGEKSKPDSSLLGVKGEALTPLRPVGTARINGRKYDVVAESGLIPAGAQVVVVEHEGLRIVVRKTAG